MSLDIKPAEELVDRELEARWAARRRGPQAEVLRWVLRTFAERGGPVPMGEVEAAFPERLVTTVRDELAKLDRADLILMAGSEIRLAYPFSATPTAFQVILPNGQERFACCATDALGIAAMLAVRILIRSACHHCRHPLELAADSTGPLGADEIRVWVGKRGEGEGRACTGV